MAIEVHIDGYDSLEQIAVGGMAAVYKARQISIDKVVAVKVLFPYLASDASFIERFQREAHSAAKVQHENIVNVIDCGESDGCYYIVMEYYQGMTLEELLKTHKLMPLDIAVNVVLDVCLGLEAAHAKDIVHRDIKPANIIYTNQGGIKIADFGLAKKSDAITVVTQPGKVVGTPAYMSPEQAAGDAVGPQSDIFSLGVVAFEVLCGSRPFEGKSYSDTLERIQTLEVPSLTHENPLIQPDFENIVEKMLAKEPVHRYASISDVITDLEKAMDTFEIKRDRRRLEKYVRNPYAYAQAFNEKMIARCLSQGTYFMQKGNSHIAEAIQEFRRILYLDPTNERARVHLNKLRDCHEGSATQVRTVVTDARQRTKSKQRSRPKNPTWKPSRVASVLGAVVLIGLGSLGAWWGWRTLRSSSAGNAAPVVSSPRVLTVTEGDRIAFSLNVIDDDNDPVNVYSNGLPTGATLSPQGHFAWQVDFSQAGRHELVFYADDGTSVVSTRTVVQVADRSVDLSFGAIPERKVQAGETVTVELDAASAIGKPVQFELGQAPAGMKLDNNRIVWTPGARQVGTHRVTVTGTDGVASESRTVVVRVDAPKQRTAPEKGQLAWQLPEPADVYVDGKLVLQGTRDVALELAPGRRTIRAELGDGLTRFEETVAISAGERVQLDVPSVKYGRISVYFLGGVGELLLNGRKFSHQPPFTGAVVPTGTYTVSCDMFHEQDSREFEVTIREGQDTIVEYEIGSEPLVKYEMVDM